MKVKNKVKGGYRVKKIIRLVLTLFLISLLTACGPKSFDSSSEIVVVTREEGSGTRGAFVELTGVEEKGAEGTKVDRTTKEAITQMKTDTVLTSVSGNQYSIGYVSTGSLNDTVKVLSIDGTKPTTENIKNGSYKISRPFNIATKGELDLLSKDFIDFIMSSEGQEIVGKSYISVNDNPSPYNGTKATGKIVIAGSSSVTPIMEKLVETYLAINRNATIEVQQSDSSAGMKAVIDGTANIGMSSRELKDSEKSELMDMPIALDGIAIVVNPSNPITDLTIEDLKSIFIGEIIKWNEITK